MILIIAALVFIGAYFIGDACDSLENKKYFAFGLDVMASVLISSALVVSSLEMANYI